MVKIRYGKGEGVAMNHGCVVVKLLGIDMRTLDKTLIIRH